MRQAIRVSTLICYLLAGVFCAVSARAEGAGGSITPIDPLSTESLFRMFGGLSLVLILVVGLVWILKKLQHFPAGSNDSIQLVGTLSVGQREKVVVVQLGDEQLVLGVCAGRIDFLHALKNPIAKNQNLNATGSFAEKFKYVLDKRPG
jgi:flagellar protein FliO/FliZ